MEKLLRTLQHEVTLWTRPSSAVNSLENSISVFTPFANGSLTETLTFAAPWATAPSSTFHFIAGRNWSPQELILWGLLKTFPQHRVYVSVSDEALNKKTSSLEILIRSSSHLFFESQPSKQKAHEILPKQKWQNWEVLTPLMDIYSPLPIKTDFIYKEPQGQLIDSKLSMTTKTPGEGIKTLILPCEGANSIFFLNKKYFNLLKSFPISFQLSSESPLQDFEDFSSRAYLSQNGFLNYEIHQGLEGAPRSPTLGHPSCLVFTAASTLTSQTLAKWMTWAVSHEIPLVMTHEQGTLFSSLWENELNCLFIDESMIRQSQNGLRDRIQSLPSKAVFSKITVDCMTNEMINAMNRIY